jgi:Transposase and inactivated derivatives
VDVYKEIRRLQLEGVTSQRAAAQRLGISRNTVKKYWEGNAVPWERKAYNRDAVVMTPEVVQFISACLDEDDQERVKKQRHTARRIFHRLVDELGFTGSESSVRNIVHDMRASRKETKVFIPLKFAPGEAVQIDWGEATVYINGEKLVVNLFCARLCHSCAPFVLAYKRQNLESFLDAIIHTFQYYGGVPRRVIFDNARVAVKSGFGAHAAAQDDYKQLAAHYGFEPVFCNPASGHEKGLVENLVGYIRRNVCVPLPKVKNLDELNGKLLEKCVQYLNHHIESRPASVGTMLAEDRLCLQALPHYTPDISKKAYPVVSRYATVLFETNLYSVPCRYTGKNTTLKAYPNHIEVWIAGTLVASHDRLFGRREESLDLQHYLPILAQKGRAIRYARPVQNSVPAEFLNWLESKDLSAKEMVELLGQCADVGYAAIMCGALPNRPKPVLNDPVAVPVVDLGAYDALCGKGVSAS